jgi:uncharacterized membrane protein YkvI
LGRRSACSRYLASKDWDGGSSFLFFTPFKIMKNVLRSIAVVAALLVFAGAAQAEFAKPAQAVHYRKSVFYVMGHHTAILGAMLEGRIPFDTQ